VSNARFRCTAPAPIASNAPAAFIRRTSGNTPPLCWPKSPTFNAPSVAFSFPPPSPRSGAVCSASASRIRTAAPTPSPAMPRICQPLPLRLLLTGSFGAVASSIIAPTAAAAAAASSAGYPPLPLPPVADAEHGLRAPISYDTVLLADSSADSNPMHSTAFGVLVADEELPRHAVLVTESAREALFKGTQLPTNTDRPDPGELIACILSIPCPIEIKQRDVKRKQERALVFHNLRLVTDASIAEFENHFVHYMGTALSSFYQLRMRDGIEWDQILNSVLVKRRVTLRAAEVVALDARLRFLRDVARVRRQPNEASLLVGCATDLMRNLEWLAVDPDSSIIGLRASAITALDALAYKILRAASTRRRCCRRGSRRRRRATPRGGTSTFWARRRLPARTRSWSSATRRACAACSTCARATSRCCASRTARPRRQTTPSASTRRRAPRQQWSTCACWRGATTARWCARASAVGRSSSIRRRCLACHSTSTTRCDARRPQSSATSTRRPTPRFAPRTARWSACRGACCRCAASTSTRSTRSPPARSSRCTRCSPASACSRRPTIRRRPTRPAAPRRGRSSRRRSRASCRPRWRRCRR
jgi:hypothetical protein